MRSPVSRREVLRGLACGGAALTGLGRTVSARGLEESGRPNFIVFTCDDAGWGDFGFHGSVIRTPNLDRMAEAGVELEQFYVCPTCSPTRASFMTGRPASRVGFIEALDFETSQTLPRDTPTLPMLLRRGGYDTALCGKWHLGNRPATGPNTFGFNHSYGHLTAWVNFYTHRSFDDMRSWHRNGIYVEENGHATDLIAAEAVRYIREIRDNSRPFFLVVHFNAPHLPLQEEGWRIEEYRGLIEFESRRYYAAMMTHMDEAIGRVLSALSAEGLSGKTLVTFFSDNGGEPPGEKSFIRPKASYNATESTELYGSNLPFRGAKFGLYEGGIRVPALMYMPGVLAPSRVSGLCAVYDVLPTLCSLAGVETGPGMGVEGINLWDAANGRTALPERTLYWRTGGQYALRDGTWKLLHAGKTLAEGSDELYDMSVDPYETKDRAAEFPEIVTRMKTMLAGEAALDRDPHLE